MRKHKAPTFRDVFDKEQANLALLGYQRDVQVVMTDGYGSDLAVGPPPEDLSHDPSDGEVYQVEVPARVVAAHEVGAVRAELLFLQLF